MKTLFIFFAGIFSFSPILFSEEIGLSVGTGNELIITASTCQKLLKQEAALCEWKKKSEPDFIIPKELSKQCAIDKKGNAKLILSTCLPQFAKNYQEKKLIHDGPNCWGTAMSFNNLSPKPRFMWPEEMMYWTNSSPLCKKIASGEKALPGDIMNIYAPEKLAPGEQNETDAGTKFWAALYPNRLTAAIKDESGSDYTGFHRLLHSVTYVTEDLAFGKDSPANEDRFYFHQLNHVYGRPVEKNCQENQSLEPHLREYNKTPKKIRGSVCSYFSQLYRCDNFAAYFTKLNLKSENLNRWKNIQALQGIQEKLFPILTSAKKILEPCEITLILNLADLTVKRASMELQQKNLDKNSEMLLTMEYFAAAALRQTLEQVDLAKKLK